MLAILSSVCTVTSRLQEDQTLFDRLSRVVLRGLRNALSDGQKSVEIIQTLVLMCNWPLDSVGQQEYSRTWQTLGMGLRYVIDAMWRPRRSRPDSRCIDPLILRVRQDGH